MNARPKLLLLSLFSLSLCSLSSPASGAEPKPTSAPASATRPTGGPSVSLKGAIEQIRLAAKTLEAIRSERDAAAASRGPSAAACKAEEFQELRRQIVELQNAASRLQPPDAVKIVIRIRILEMTGKSAVEFAQRMLPADGREVAPLTEAKTKELMDILKQAGGLKVLAEPTLVTMIGQPASVRSGGEFPILIPNEKGHVDVVWRDYGVWCSAIAVPAEDVGKLDLSVHAQVSKKDFSNPLSTQHGLSVPAVPTHSVNTQVTLGYDETSILGGSFTKLQEQSAKTKDAPAESAVAYLVTVSRENAPNPTAGSKPTR